MTNKPRAAELRRGRTRRAILPFCCTYAVVHLRGGWWNPISPPPTWPFEDTKEGAWARFVDIFNRTDPTGLPASDYAEPRTKANANKFTFDAGYDDLNKFEARVFGVWGSVISIASRTDC